MSTAVLDDKTQKVFEEIKTLSFLQTANLVKAFEEEFGITAAVAGPAVVAAAPAAAAEEESSTVSLILEDAGANKIGALKVVRELTSLGLKEAKELVDKAGSAILENVEKKVAEEAAAKLKEAGATVKIK
jgi:large subunit ribosomal protein L7/L12